MTCKNGWRIFTKFGGKTWDVIDLIQITWWGDLGDLKERCREDEGEV